MFPSPFRDCIAHLFPSQFLDRSGWNCCQHPEGTNNSAAPNPPMFKREHIPTLPRLSPSATRVGDLSGPLPPPY
jgi:hypothetical protein